MVRLSPCVALQVGSNFTTVASPCGVKTIVIIFGEGARQKTREYGLSYILGLLVVSRDRDLFSIQFLDSLYPGWHSESFDLLYFFDLSVRIMLAIVHFCDVVEQDAALTLGTGPRFVYHRIQVDPVFGFASSHRGRRWLITSFRILELDPLMRTRRTESNGTFSLL
jgi:hypothetical protein